MTKPRKSRVPQPHIPEIIPEEEALLARIEAEADPDDIFPTEAELAGAMERRGRGRPKRAGACLAAPGPGGGRGLPRHRARLAEPDQRDPAEGPRVRGEVSGTPYGSRTRLFRLKI